MSSTCPRCGNNDPGRVAAHRERDGDDGGWGPARSKQCLKCGHEAWTVEWQEIMAAKGNHVAKFLLDEQREKLWQ